MLRILIGFLACVSTPVFAQDAEESADVAAVVSAAPVPESLNGRIADVRIKGLRRVEEAALMAAVATARAKSTNCQ